MGGARLVISRAPVQSTVDGGRTRYLYFRANHKRWVIGDKIARHWFAHIDTNDGMLPRGCVLPRDARTHGAHGHSTARIHFAYKALANKEILHRVVL